MKKKARSSKSKKSNRTSSVRPPDVTASASTRGVATSAKIDSTPPSAPTLAAMEVAPRLMDPDEISIPPAVPVVDLDDNFFSAPRSIHTLGAAAHHDEDEPDPISHKMTPHVRARRERFSKYVKATVAVAAAVCAMAMIRSSVGGAHKDSDPTPVAAAEPRATPVAARESAPEPPKAAAPAIPVDVPPVAEIAAPVEAKADAKAPSTVETHAPAEPAKATPAVATPTDPSSTKTALEEKRASRTMLERGKIAAAIEAGERAVALDATDGESWLLLGAAYQEKGRTADARKAFTSCIKEGKKGPIGECRAMLR